MQSECNQIILDHLRSSQISQIILDHLRSSKTILDLLRSTQFEVWMTRTPKRIIDFYYFSWSGRPPTHFVRILPSHLGISDDIFFFSGKTRYFYGVAFVLPFSKLIIRKNKVFFQHPRTYICTGLRVKTPRHLNIWKQIHAIVNPKHFSTVGMNL